MVYLSLHELGDFRNTLCDIIVVTLVSFDQAIELEVEHVVKLSIDQLEHLW